MNDKSWQVFLLGQMVSMIGPTLIIFAVLFLIRILGRLAGTKGPSWPAFIVGVFAADAIQLLYTHEMGIFELAWNEVRVFTQLPHSYVPHNMDLDAGLAALPLFLIMTGWAILKLLIAAVKRVMGAGTAYPQQGDDPGAGAGPSYPESARPGPVIDVPVYPERQRFGRGLHNEFQLDHATGEYRRILDRGTSQHGPRLDARPRKQRVEEQLDLLERRRKAWLALLGYVVVSGPLAYWIYGKVGDLRRAGNVDLGNLAIWIIGGLFVAGVFVTAISRMFTVARLDIPYHLGFQHIKGAKVLDPVVPSTRHRDQTKQDPHGNRSSGEGTI
jgi:hypothetical protein